MTRVQEAILAFIGTNEIRRDPMAAAENPGALPLVAEGMAFVTDGKLYVSSKGWRFLDSSARQHQHYA